MRILLLVLFLFVGGMGLFYWLGMHPKTVEQSTKAVGSRLSGAEQKAIGSDDSSGLLGGGPDRQEPLEAYEVTKNYALTSRGEFHVGDHTVYGLVTGIWPLGLEIDKGAKFIPMQHRPVFKPVSYVFRCRPIDGLKEQLAKMPEVIVDTISNSATVIEDKDRADSFLEMCKSLDQVPRTLVGSVTLATYSNINDLKLGVDLGAQLLQSQLGVNLGQASPVDIAGGVAGLLTMFRGQVAVYLQAIQQKAHAKLTNRNDVRLVEGQVYETTIGESVPYSGNQTLAAGIGSQSSVSFLNVSFTVKLVYVRAGDADAIDYSISNNQLEGFQQVAPGTNAPQTAIETASGRILIEPRHIAVVTSLGLDNDSRTKTGVPGLMEIPLVGALFTRTVNNHTNQHLQVIIESDSHE